MEKLSSISTQLQLLNAIISIESTDSLFSETAQKLNFFNVEEISTQLNLSHQSLTSASTTSEDYIHFKGDADDLATIVYTSGTTGKPKGVMLSHNNILYNTWFAITAVPCRNDDLFLSFLPVSHMFERSAGYYIPMMSGAEVAYARSIDELSVDLQNIKPTVLVDGTTNI